MTPLGEASRAAAPTAADERGGKASARRYLGYLGLPGSGRGTRGGKPERSYLGYLDRVADGRAHGWVWNPEAPSERVVVELQVDGQGVLRAEADLDRPDLKEAGYGDGRHGFSLDLPDQYLDGLNHQIGIVVFATGKPLSGSPKAYSQRATGLASLARSAPVAAHAAAVSGFFDKIVDGVAIGWACNPNDPSERLVLELQVDNESASIATADIERPDVLEAGHGDGRNGFAIRLPQHALDGRSHNIGIVVSGTNQPIPGGPHKVTIPRTGATFLDRASASIRGWATPGLSVVVRFDGADPAVVTPSLPVAGFGGAASPGTACGFSVPIPAAYLDGAWHMASVKFAAGDQDLPGAPFGFRLEAPRVRIHLDTTGSRAVSGWAVDPKNPSAPVKLFIFIDGISFGEVVASKRRSPDGFDQAARRADGFSFTIPRKARRLDLSASMNLARDVIAGFDLDPTGSLVPPPADTDTYMPPELPDDAAGIEAITRADAAFLAEPGPWFDAEWYLQTYGGWDRAAFPTAFAHYQAVGRGLSRSPSALFDEAWYRERWPSVGRAVEAGRIPSALAHYLAVGAKAGLDPIPGFSGRDYLAAHPEVASADGLPGPLWHWLRSGAGSSYAPNCRDAALPPLRPAHAGAPPPSIVAPALAHGIYATWISRLDADAADSAAKPVLVGSDLAATRFVVEVALPATPLVSIIMPTFNRAYTIAEAIQSVVDQTYGNWELLVCDDGSFDKTALVVTQFADPRVRYMHFEKSNGAQTRNKGLSLARGEYIAYLDSDNIWHPLYLDVMLRELLRSPGWPCAYSGYIDTEIVGSRIVLNALSAQPFNAVKFSERNFIDLNTICHHRCLYDWLGGFDNDLPRLQDWDLTLRYLSVFKPTSVPFFLAYYRRNVAWGQVTHLFMDQDVSSIVQGKTTARLNLDHARLAIPWPARPKLVMLVGQGPGHVLLASLIARQLVDTADVVILHTDQADFSAKILPDEVLCVPVARKAFETPHRLASTIIPFLSRDGVVLGLGLSEATAQGLRTRLPVGVDCLALDQNGLGLTGPASLRPFQIGSLPLAIAAEPPAKADLPSGVAAVVLLLTGGRARGSSPGSALQWMEKTPDVAVILAPPDPATGEWCLVHANGVIPWPETGLDAMSRALAMAETISTLGPIEESHPLNFLILIEAMARGVVVMLPPSPFSRPLIEGRAMYEVAVSEGGWLLDKVKRLKRPNIEAERFARNALKVFKLVFHPELGKERLRFYLYARIFGEGL